ncbi:hypothetical protein [Nevskia sp.]|uniref:hypothetical protein n=1 Tax=Nevskia sp. TaxID=1929292 RepID=UPI003F72D837
MNALTLLVGGIGGSCRRVTYLLFLICVTFGVLAGTASAVEPSEAAMAPDGEEKVLIWRRVRNDFHNASFPTEQLAELVNKTPTKVIKIASGQTLSSELQKSFNISSTWTPEMYEEMVSHIVDINGLESPDQIPADAALQVPDVPRTGQIYTPGNPWIAGQHVKLIGAFPSVVATTVVGPTLSSFKGAIPQSELQYFVIPRRELKNYFLNGYVEQGASGLLGIELGQEPGSPSTLSDKVLSAADSKRLKDGLESAGANKPRPVVVVLDASIPDDVEFLKSKQFIQEVSKTVREKYGLGDSPFFKAIGEAGHNLEYGPEKLYPNFSTHAALIKHSLDEFEALDPLDRVQVVYLPLSHSQNEVDVLLKELVYLAQIIKSTKPVFPPLAIASPNIRRAAEAATNTIVELNPQVFGYDSVATISSGVGNTRTDRALLEALSVVMSYYSTATSRPHALSFSWQVNGLDVPATFQSNEFGWRVTAAGNQIANTNGVDLIDRQLQFAARAAEPKDFVVVMNSMGSTGRCPSNLFNDSGLDVVALAFPGNVNASLCGTSFSTPRVAWLLAAREAIVGKVQPFPVGESAKIMWLNSQRNLVMRLRRQSTDFFARYGLDIEKLLDQK